METYNITHPHEFIEEMKPKVIALGFFDGVHLGHQKVINTAVNTANVRGVEAAVMTFHPHPLVVLSNGKREVEYLTPLQEKLKRIASLGVHKCYVIKFDKDFAKLTPQQFVDQYIIALNTVHVVAGFDFSYGSLGRGTMETLPFHSRGAFDQTEIGKVVKSDEKISSTLIRSLIIDGKVSDVVDYLGRFYEVEGTVIKGEQRGRQLGFPTANIKLDENYICPKNGVYSVNVLVEGEWYKGVCNIGKKPTFHDTFEQTVEVHILDFSEDIYGKTVKITWLTRLRDEKKFSSIDELLGQIKQDIKDTEQFFKNRK
ncbi:riboflavin biosynthesis protein RibF [Lottiidibacillus patelloidae]|uniref:Riboflavin biosynthesis protein n=1 Tax=Lottiidibacillus patelloidae TaxID=2670334 RepID=A0A263BZN8_9BACI|nr:bifunctional riboflavin kinase/FAD synthetase [Lottiidibacillus patelloidae]OZM58616.1 riboflavin biosynthesis protein RibF [Lottiidibacillus patelloidae]